MTNNSQTNDIPQSYDSANVTGAKDNNTASLFPLLKDVRKFRYFDYSKGKKFSVNIFSRLFQLGMGISALLLTFVVFLLPGNGASGNELLMACIIGIVSAAFGLWFISFTFQKTEIGCDGISMRNLKYGILHKTSLRWDDIEEINLYEQTVRGIKSYTAEILTTYGKKEKINLTAMNESSHMIYNLIIAYINYSKDRDFDWSQIMRAPQEKEPLQKSIIMTIVAFFVSLIVSFAILNIIAEQTYSHNLYSWDHKYSDAQMKSIEKRIEASTGCPYVYLSDINTEKNLVVASVDSKYGIYNYKTGRWLMQPVSKDEYDLHSGYFTKEHDKGNYEHEIVATYDYDGNESLFWMLMGWLPVYGAVISAILVSIAYFTNRRRNK